MLINLGRLADAVRLGLSVIESVSALPEAAEYLCQRRADFMILMHGLQLTLLKATQPKEAPPLSRFEQIRIFIFGVFELVAWQKKLKATLKK